MSVREIFFTFSAFRVIDRKAFPYFEILATEVKVLRVCELNNSANRYRVNIAFTELLYSYFSLTNDHRFVKIKDKFQLSLPERQRKRHQREMNNGKTNAVSQLRRSRLRISELHIFSQYF